MLFSEVPVGALVRFGHFAGTDLVWTKVDPNGDLLLTGMPFAVRYDDAEPLASNRERRTHGNSFYPHSNVRQWLNSDAPGNWFRSTTECDTITPYSASRYPGAGFLCAFDRGERELLVKRQVLSAVPRGLQRTYGQFRSNLEFVSLPSVDELHPSLRAGEANRWAIVDTFRRGEIPSQFIGLTRSSTGDPHTIYAVTRANPNYRVKYANETEYSPTHPVIRLRLDCLLDEIDDSGIFSVIPPATCGIDPSELMKILLG